jgi:hypothetical protein
MIFRLELRVENIFDFAVLADDVSLATSQETKVLLNTDLFADGIAFINHQYLGDVGALGPLFISDTNHSDAGLLERCVLLVKSSILLLARWSIISAEEVDNRLLSTDTQLLQLKEPHRDVRSCHFAILPRRRLTLLLGITTYGILGKAFSDLKSHREGSRAPCIGVWGECITGRCNSKKSNDTGNLHRYRNLLR